MSLGVIQQSGEKFQRDALARAWSAGWLRGPLQIQSLGFSLVVRKPRTNALFGQVIKLVLAVV